MEVPRNSSGDLETAVSPAEQSSGRTAEENSETNAVLANTVNTTADEGETNNGNLTGEKIVNL